MAENEKTTDENEPDEGVTYTKPTSQLDLEARLANDNEAPAAVKTLNPSEQGEDDEDGYVGTDPIYQNHANDTEAPGEAEEGAEKDALDLHFASVATEPGKETETSKAIKETAEGLREHTTGELKTSPTGAATVTDGKVDSGKTAPAKTSSNT